MDVNIQHTCDNILRNILAVSMAFWNSHERCDFCNFGTLPLWQCGYPRQYLYIFTCPKPISGHKLSPKVAVWFQWKYRQTWQSHTSPQYTVPVSHSHGRH